MTRVAPQTDRNRQKQTETDRDRQRDARVCGRVGIIGDNQRQVGGN